MNIKTIQLSSEERTVAVPKCPLFGGSTVCTHNYVCAYLYNFLQYILYFSAPTAPPTSFNVIAINSTTLEFQWGLPIVQHRNGIIQGYTLFLRPANKEEIVVTISSNMTMEYLFVGLTPSTAYTCSVLAFTNENGPRSVYLTVVTPGSGIYQYITLNVHLETFTYVDFYVAN